MRRRPAALISALLLAATAGCGGPRLIQDYTVRNDQVVFAVQEGTSYSFGDCKRAADGTLSGCDLRPVEFE